jgi:hypothetical protein
MLSRLQGKAIFIHIFFIALFLMVPTLAFVRPPGESFFTITKVFVQDTTANFVLLCFFYLNYYVLIPRFYFTHKYVQYVLYVIAFLSLAFMLPYVAGKYIPGGENHAPGFPGPHGGFGNNPPPSVASFVFDEFRRHLFLFFTAVFFSFLLRTRERLAQLKEEKLSAELSSLKAQINPHFLFNTLNSIYTLSVKKDDKAGDAIIHLSGLMRYVIKEANGSFIPLQKELVYINNYIELQKARLGNTAVIEFSCSGQPGNLQMAPLILISFIENAFMHGINPDEEKSIVQVSISITGPVLKLYVFNNKVPVSASVHSTGIGMANTTGRLAMIYPDKHTIKVNETAETYTVNLTIDLQ